jgi:hypothetical protein
MSLAKMLMLGMLGGRGADPWSPIRLQDVKVVIDTTSTEYQDAAMTTLAAAGDPVGAITDVSGNAKHATQSVDANRYTKRLAMIKDASNMNLENYGAKELDLPDLFGTTCTALTVAFLFRSAWVNASNEGYLWVSSTGGLASTNDYIGVRIISGQYQIVINQAGGSAGLVISTGIVPDQNPHVVCLRWDNVKVYLDVDEQHYEAAANVGALNLSTRNTFGAAYSAGAYALPVKGLYYGLVGVARCITNAELILLQAYYARLYGTPFYDYYNSVATGLGAAALHDHNWQPQIVRLASGRLFIVFTEYPTTMETGASVIRSGYSDDDGATWSAGTDVVGDGTTDSVNNGGLFILSNGNIICTYYRRTVGGGVDAFSYRKISTDGGENWGAEASLGDLLGAGVNYVPYTNGVTLENDTILQPCYSYGNTVTGPTNRIFIAKSTDGGDSWTMITMATGAGVSFSPYNENPLARNGNTIVSMVRNEVTHTYWYTKSTDLGESWSAPVNTGLGTAGLGFQSLVYDGDMLIFYDRVITPNVRISWDDGQTWTFANLLNDIDGSTNNSYYTSHVLISSGRRYMVYDTGRKIRCFVTSSGAWI